MSSKKREDLFDDDSSEDEDDDAVAKPPPKKKKKLNSLIDDAAEESGEEGDDDEDEDDDEDNNDYVKDGFVVDEHEEEEKKKKDDLEDSDDEDDDSDEEKDSPAKRLKKVRKMREYDRLDDEDLALIQEAQGLDQLPASSRPEPVERQTIVAKSEAELRKGLFYDSDGEQEGGAKAKDDVRKPTRVERYDEDGMDDFIDDDIGDQGDILASERRGRYDEEDDREINEAQLQEASDIFGTDYLEFMQEEEQADDDEEELLGKKYRERGVGVDLGVDSDEEIISDDEDDDDLFGDDDDDMDEQKAEALRLKREKRKLDKAERRRQSLAKKTERRRAQLRRAFEPVQLVENFCTERDDEIRAADAPERFFDWKVPFHGSEADGMNEDEKQEATWIASRIPDIAQEFAAATSESQQRSILESIAYALRFMHRDKVEPAFIKRYRRDYVVSPAVRENLYAVQDEDGEWDRILSAREKVDSVIMQVTAAVDSDETTGVDAQKLQKLQDELEEAQAKLEDAAKQESVVKRDLEGLPAVDDDDDDELFGDSGGAAEDKKSERERLTSHLKTIQELMETRAEKVSQLQAQVQVAEAQNQALSDPKPIERVTKKTCRDLLWNAPDYLKYLSQLSDTRHILDLNSYVVLLKEGNDAIRKKELPLLDIEDGKKDKRKRSRRYDRDFYRTCVAEGLRAVCYRYLLAPNRVGIKLEDTVTQGIFDYTKTMVGEESTEGSGDPLKWVAPSIPSASPSEFANDLVESGELVLLSSNASKGDSEKDKSDPLRGCRYVAAMELAHEPRVRRYLRTIYRRNAMLTTRPTKKGMEEIDAFHDFYGLHLIRNKPTKDHFPMDEQENEDRKAMLSSAERAEFEREIRKRQRDSCLLYLNILKAEQIGDISVHIHLPFIEQGEDWYSVDKERFNDRENQQMNCMLDELKKVYYPTDGDTDEWNAEREKVLKLALSTFLLPQFESELRRDLREAASKEGVAAAGENLREVAMQGPYRPAALLHTENRFIYPTGDLPLVGVCCSADPKEATYLASVNEHGESGDYLAIPGGTKVDSPKMREKVIMFLLQTRPAAVVVGTSGGFESRLFHRKMGEVVTEAVQRWRSRDIQGEDEDDEAFEARQHFFRQLTPAGHFDDYEEDQWKCNVELIDDSVSQLFGRSVRGKKEFPDHAVNLRVAISTARFAKDPLGEYTYTWSVASDAGMFGTEMLYLNIHPMQQLMPRAQLLREYERVLCECVADVGADLNTSTAHDHLRGLLMFVPGLGPRKAAHIKHLLSQHGGAVARRRDLLEKRLLGPVVYNNAVAFLRISEVDQLIDHALHPLDDTRLHPDVYMRNNWAIKIAFDALERDEMRNKESAVMKALGDVMENSGKEVERLYRATKEEWEKHYGPTFNVKEWDPRINVPADRWHDKVEELDLNAFANMIADNNQGRWHSHLEMIKWEFRLPFADPRMPMEPLAGDKLFRLITGESDQSLRPGKEVTGKIVRNGDFGSRVKLEGDIPAFIPLRNLSDEHVESADDFVMPGQVVTAVVTEVKKDHMTVDLSLKMEDFRKEPSSWDRPQSLPEIDAHFDYSAARRIELDNAKKREAHIEALQQSLGLKPEDDGDGSPKKKRLGRAVRRACTHPAFRNAKNDEVMNELKDAGAAMVGEALIRPSAKSSDSLAIHWVVREGNIKVVEVLEDDKETEASIGNILKIKDEVYGSIDELLGRYIAPMNDFVEELVNHRKFLDLPEEEVDEKLMEQKKAVPKAIPYNLCWMDAHPGYACLRYMGSVTPRSHPIGITPKGFAWGDNVYPNLDRLINEFKRNPKGTSTKPKPPAAAAAGAPKPPPTKPGRWGAAPPKPPPPPAAPPQYAPAPTPAYRPPPPPAPPQWQAPPVHAYQQQPPPVYQYPPPQAYGYPQAPPPPPHQYQQPPPSHRPPPPNLPPPPQYHQPPPPPAFEQPQQGASQGRGRGRTLPAWMSKQ